MTLESLFILNDKNMKYIIFIFSLLCSLISNVCSAGGAEKLLESVCRKKPNLSYCSNYSTTTGVPTTRNKIITRATTTTTTTRRPTSVLTRKNDLVPFPFGLDNSKKNVSQPKIDPKVLKELEGIKQVQHSSFQHSNHWGFNEAEAKKVFNNFMAREEAIKKRLEEEKKKSTKATSPKVNS
uniref:Uncharacterized protein n=1 Tax=Strongyloides venezuelensis TaxID=75913 RepID=A0A0K0FPP2_STRVS